MRKGKRRSFEQRNYVFLKPSRGHLQVVALALHSQQPALRVQLLQAEPVFGVNAALIERHNGLVLAQLVELEVGALAGLNLHRNRLETLKRMVGEGVMVVARQKEVRAGACRGRDGHHAVAREHDKDEGLER